MFDLKRTVGATQVKRMDRERISSFLLFRKLWDKLFVSNIKY